MLVLSKVLGVMFAQPKVNWYQSVCAGSGSQEMGCSEGGRGGCESFAGEGL